MVVRKRLDIKGTALVFVTTTVKDWIPVFQEEEIVHIIIGQLRESLDYFEVSLVGYVIMPTHLHLLLGFRQIERLSKFMQSFKILSAKAVKKVTSGRIGLSLMEEGRFRLWRPRFDDLIITSQRQFQVKLDYIHNNPVKAGFVERAQDWNFSSAMDWLGNKCGLLPIDKDFKWAV
jgi:putative transposase